MKGKWDGRVGCCSREGREENTESKEEEEEEEEELHKKPI